METLKSFLFSLLSFRKSTVRLLMSWMHKRKSSTDFDLSANTLLEADWPRTKPKHALIGRIFPGPIAPIRTLPGLFPYFYRIGRDLNPLLPLFHFDPGPNPIKSGGFEGAASRLRSIRERLRARRSERFRARTSLSAFSFFFAVNIKESRW